MGDFFSEGRATYGGDVVINPHGGLLSEGYIHGMNHHYEAVHQLRHEAGDRKVEGAQTALVTAGAGPYGGRSDLLVGFLMPVMPPPQPLVDVDSQEFWTALSEGRLSMQRCSQCRRFQHPPAERCKTCDG